MNNNIDYPDGGFPKLKINNDNEINMSLLKKREFDNKKILSIRSILEEQNDDNKKSSLIYLKRAEKKKKKREKKEENIDVDIDINQFKKNINISDINKPIDIKRIIKKKDLIYE